MKPSVRVISAASVLALLAFAGSGSAEPAPKPRLVVLGFDGVSADRTERLLSEGRLPNLEALGKRGSYSRLMPSNPAQSPVSWATITTGTNPGAHGIFDFLRRKPDARGELQIDIGLAEQGEDMTILGAPSRIALLAAIAVVGGVAGLAVVLALFAGKRRARRPHGLLQGVATGGAALFASVGYVALAWVPAAVPTARNLRSGDPFWVTLDKVGVRCIALEAPVSFPADEMHSGCCLSGLGVPDVQQTWGTYALWTDDPNPPSELEMGGRSFFIAPGATSFDLVLAGPPLPSPDRSAVVAALLASEVEENRRNAAFDWTAAQRRASETKGDLLRLAGSATAHVAATVARGSGMDLVTHEGVAVALLPDKWSDLVPVVFQMTPIAKVHARVRFLLQSAGSANDARAPFSLLVTPVQFDAAELPPNVRIASPMSFAKELANTNGQFETLGWPEMNNAVKDDAIADRAFLDHIEILRKNREKRLLERLARDDWDVVFAMFSEPDRVQHALYRHVDDKSPRHDPKLAAEFGPEIDRAYTEMDRFVGEVLAKIGPKTDVLVCSDHGFAPFRRGVNLNNLLRKAGFQVKKGQGTRGNLFDLRRGATFPDVDWTQSKAYAMGLGNLYLNLEGREPHGIVKEADVDTVLGGIEKALLELRDKDGTKVVRHVYRGRDLYHGARAAEAPDLVVGFEWGYRVSWQNCLGHCEEDVLSDNTFRWSGDHCSVDPELVKGVLFSSIPIEPSPEPNVVDIAPSILTMYGLPQPHPDGRNLFAVPR